MPPDGPLTLVVAWPAFAVEETHQRVDPAWSSAVADVVVLWPEPDQPSSAPRTPPPPDVPPGSWFAAGR